MNEKPHSSDGSFLASIIVIGFFVFITTGLIGHYNLRIANVKANAEVKKVQIEQEMKLESDE